MDNNPNQDFGTIRPQAPWGVGWAGRPSPMRMIARNIFHILRHIKAVWGIEPRVCSVCGFKGRFHAYGSPPRYDAACPRCGSLERHRQIALWLHRNEAVWSGKRVLQFAPDAGLRRILEAGAVTYTGADIVAVPGCIQQNIEDMDCEDNAFDLIVCSHVLEHVNDQAALPELKRVLAPTGILLVMVPLVYAWEETYENPSIESPQGRFLHFAQDDHVRYYGRDLKQRITATGLEVYENIAQEPDVSRYGLMRGDVLYVGTSEVDRLS